MQGQKKIACVESISDGLLRCRCIWSVPMHVHNCATIWHDVPDRRKQHCLTWEGWMKFQGKLVIHIVSYKSDSSRWRNNLLHVDIPIQVPPVSDHASQEITICTWRDAIDAVVRTHEAAGPAILDAAPEGRVVSIFQISDCDLHRRAGDGRHWRYKLLEG